MTSLTLDESSAQYQIRSYQPGSIQINDKFYQSSVIITPTQLIENWSPQTVNELTALSLQAAIESRPDVLLIGTGGELIFPPIAIYGELINQGIGVEIMSTSAACRTYNALAAENRRVVAALIIR